MLLEAEESATKPEEPPAKRVRLSPSEAIVLSNDLWQLILSNKNIYPDPKDSFERFSSLMQVCRQWTRCMKMNLIPLLCSNTIDLKCLIGWKFNESKIISTIQNNGVPLNQLTTLDFRNFHLTKHTFNKWISTCPLIQKIIVKSVTFDLNALSQLSQLKIFKADSIGQQKLQKVTQLSSFTLHEATNLTVPILTNFTAITKLTLKFNKIWEDQPHPIPISVEKLHLRNCHSAGLNFNNLSRLKTLNICKIENPPNINELPSLTKLKITHCRRLMNDYLSSSQSLETLYLKQIYPPNLNCLTNLTELHLTDIETKDSQNDFSDSIKLRKLVLERSRFSTISIQNLEELTLVDCSYPNNSFNLLTNLKQLKIYDHTNVRLGYFGEFTLSLAHLKNLNTLAISTLFSLSLTLPEQLQFLEMHCPGIRNLTHGILKGVGIQSNPQLLSYFTNRGIPAYEYSTPHF